HSWYLPKWLQRVLPKIDIEGHALQDENFISKENTVPEHTIVDGIDQMQAIATPNVRLDDRTLQLYNDLLENTSNHSNLFNSLLFNALMQYAKDNNQDIYDKYSAKTDDQNTEDHSNSKPSDEQPKIQQH